MANLDAIIDVELSVETRRERRSQLTSQVGAIVLVVAGLCVSCGGQTVRMSDQFWLRAPGPARIRLTPPLVVGVPGEVKTHIVEGIVTNHTSSGRSGVDYRLALKTTTDKRVEFTYQLGGKRRIPVNTGDTLQLVVVLRSHVSDDRHDRGMLLYRLDAEPVTEPREIAQLTPPKGPGAKNRDAETMGKSRRKTLIAAVDENKLLQEDKLPAALKALRPTDIAAYRESGRFNGACQLVREQRYFRLTRPVLLVKSRAKILNKKLYAPGSRLQLRDTATKDFEVMLLRNLSVVRSTCRDRPEPTWTWAAIQVEHPAIEAPQ